MHSFLQILIRVFAICLMICAGVLARRRGILDASSTKSLSLLSTNFIYPAAIFSSLVGNFTLGRICSNWSLPVGTMMIFAIGFAVGGVCLCFMGKRSQGERRMFHFQSTVNNYVFLPMPLIMHAYGDAGVGLLSLSTVGSEIAVWTLGSIAISGGFSLKQMKKLLNMPMLAVAVSVVVLAIREYCPFSLAENSIGYDIFQTFLGTAKLFGAGTVAIAMIVAGSRMAELRFVSIFNSLEAILVPVRLLLVPAFCLAAIFFLPFSAEARNVLLFIAVMPASVASVALSDYFGADTETAASSVMLTHLFCMLTIPLWLAIIKA